MPRSTDYRTHAWRTHYVGRRRPLVGPKIAYYDPPRGGVELTAAPLAPAANEAFSPAELAARIAKHRRRVRENLRTARRVQAVCWCCGAVCPSGSWVEAAGWYSREINIAGWCGSELYCGPCFYRWGWPDAPKK